MMNNKKQLSWQVLSKNILAQAEPNKSSTIYYVGLFKESETGLLFNERMLVLQDKKFTIFYTKHFKSYPALLELERQGVRVIKERVSIMNCSASGQQNLITISLVNEEYDQKKWIFKFSSQKLAEKWLHLFTELQEKCATRSAKSKETKSTGFASEYSSILANISMLDKFNFDNAEKEEEESEESGRLKRVNVRKMEKEFN